MDVAQEETFGPVTPVIRFSDRDEAIHLANETKYGLTGAVFTSSLTSAWFMAENIDCGTVHVNETTNYWELLAPFGG
jgi:acyl-CoA reductase-like NAD-dependent aldehyde dehydrogenase